MTFDLLQQPHVLIVSILQLLRWAALLRWRPLAELLYHTYEGLRHLFLLGSAEEGCELALEDGAIAQHGEGDLDID